MATEHNAISYAPQLTKAGVKAVGLDETQGGISRLSETLGPIIDLWSRPEWHALRQSTLWSAFHDQAAVAGEFGFVGIRNPAGSGIIAVVSHIRTWNPAGTMRVAVFHGPVVNTDVDGSEQVVPRDTRFNLTGVSNLVKIHGAGVAAIGNDALEQNIQTAAQEETPLWGDRIISPGFELRIYGQSGAVELFVSMAGYLWKFLPGEDRLG